MPGVVHQADQGEPGLEDRGMDGGRPVGTCQVDLDRREALGQSELGRQVDPDHGERPGARDLLCNHAADASGGSGDHDHPIHGRAFPKWPGPIRSSSPVIPGERSK